MKKVLAIIDFKNLSTNIKEGSKFIFNSKILIQHFSDIVQKSECIDNIIFLNNPIEICKNNFEAKSDLYKIIQIKAIDKEFSYSHNGILKVIKELEKKGFFLTLLLIYHLIIQL